MCICDCADIVNVSFDIMDWVGVFAVDFDKGIDVTVCDSAYSEIEEFIVSMQECMHRSDDRNQKRVRSVSWKNWNRVWRFKPFFI